MAADSRSRGRHMITPGGCGRAAARGACLEARRRCHHAGIKLLACLARHALAHTAASCIAALHAAAHASY